MYKMALTNKRRVKFNSKWKQTVIILVFQIQFNLSLRTPLYYGQFVWSQKCQNSYIPYLSL